MTWKGTIFKLLAVLVKAKQFENLNFLLSLYQMAQNQIDLILGPQLIDMHRTSLLKLKQDQSSALACAVPVGQGS